MSFPFFSIERTLSLSLSVSISPCLTVPLSLSVSRPQCADPPYAINGINKRSCFDCLVVVFVLVYRVLYTCFNVVHMHVYMLSELPINSALTGVVHCVSSH